MREQKSRAWANGYNCWCYRLDYIDGVWLGYVKKDGREYSTTDIIIEQCTGLKAKNGKEIYEGDIVQCYDPGYKSTDKRFGGPSVVDRFYSDTWDYEILGNVHENPELLGGRK